MNGAIPPSGLLRGDRQQLLSCDALRDWRSGEPHEGAGVVRASELFLCDPTTKSLVAEEFCVEVPKSILDLTDLTESLWQCTDAAWLDPLAVAAKRSAAASRSASGRPDERVISRGELLAMRGRARRPLGAQMPTLLAKPVSSGSAPRSHTGKASRARDEVPGWLASSSAKSCGSDSNPVASWTRPLSESSLQDDAEDSCVTEDDVLDDAEIIIGPSRLAFSPLDAGALAMPDGESASGAAIKSSEAALYLTDIRRLTSARESLGGPLQPLSFGSALHANGHGDKCRPCLFERAPGRCRRLWLCDFCHLHEGRRPKVRPSSLPGVSAQ